MLKLNVLTPILNRRICAFLMFYLTATFCSAAAYELIPSWKRIMGDGDERRFVYRVFYVNNVKKNISLCFAELIEKSKQLTLECGAVVVLDWKLPSSVNVRSMLVGRFDDIDVDDNLKIPFGLWQIDEVTGDWQFCIDGQLIKENCVLSKAK